MSKLKKILTVIHKFKSIIFLGAIFFAYYSYIINVANDYKGFVFVMIAESALVFMVLALVLIFIDHFVATIIFLVITILFLFSINSLTGTTKYLRKKTLDPCYKIDNIRYIGKGPWQYNLDDRVCIGKRYGDTIIYETKLY